MPDLRAVPKAAQRAIPRFAPRQTIWPIGQCANAALWPDRVSCAYCRHSEPLPAPHATNRHQGPILRPRAADAEWDSAKAQGDKAVANSARKGFAAHQELR